MVGLRSAKNRTEENPPAHRACAPSACPSLPPPTTPFSAIWFPRRESLYFSLHAPMFSASLVSLSLLCAIHGARAQYSATYLPSNAPATTEEGQTGTNQCGTGLNQTSDCQNAYINSLDDWCIWSPPDPGAGSVIGNTERIEVAWCLKNGTGTRLIPDGAITGAHFVVTPDFVQVTGVGNLTLLNIPAGDAGGELDPHGADGNGNPIGGLVFSSAFGPLQQIHEWTNFVSDGQFCFRACNPAGSMAPAWCQHIYDVMGCAWNMPANYNPGVFEQCKGDSGEPMGVYGGSTFQQGQGATPAAHPAPSSSDCTTMTSIGNGFLISGTSIGTVGPTTSSAASSGSAGHSGSSGASASPTGSASGALAMWGPQQVAYAIGSTFIGTLLGGMLVVL
ncbi:hypothetical protein BDN72DRAFT_198280 [Pluteus cervinus]|uniref:Uncharacterized protein n=1 Tax=Pluteus cervinus TaxID=181527 RepID=A0ACD3B618_9AGAR|nr:hypothetical protein BDN72DRAFT_198280 [Pluteus cervinus]